MNTRWHRQDRTQADWQEAELDQRSRAIPLRQRLDPVVIFGSLIVFAILLLVFVAFFVIGKRLGLLQSPQLEPIKDERLLENVRDHLQERPLSDASLHNGEVWLSQQGGVLHRYQPELGLWTTQRPFPEDQLEYLRLQSEQNESSLWALTDNDGLARYHQNRWQLLFSPTPFQDENGKNFETADLSCAALSDDGNWLMVGTKYDGVGLYHIQERRWLNLRKRQTGLPAGTTVTKLAYWHHHFWIASPAGLFRMDPQNLAFVRTEIGQPITDLDADPEGALWVLARKQEPKQARWLGKITDPAQPAQVLMDERENYPELNMADLHTAYQEGDQLLLIGRAGMFTYHTGQHYWTRLYKQEVQVAHRHQRGHVHFSGPGLIGVLEGETIRTWPLKQERIQQMSTAPSGDTLALTELGNVYRLGIDQPPNRVFTGMDQITRQRTNQRYTNGVAMGDELLLLGKDTGLLHQAVERTYRDVPVKNLPKWLHRPATELAYSGGHLYIMHPQAAGMDMYTWPAKALAKLAKQGLADPQEMPIPRTRPMDWNDKGLYYIAVDGRVMAFTPEGGLAVTGEARSALKDLQYLDVAAWGNDLVFATNKGLIVYDRHTRSWGPLKKSPPGLRIEELATHGTQLLMRTQSGSLLASTNHRLNGPHHGLIGAGRGFSISQNQISDVHQENERLYLAGNGRVELYDSQARAITQRWPIAANGAVTLEGSLDGQPLAIAAGRAILGKQHLQPEAGEVQAMGTDEEFVWTLRHKNKSRYLRGHRKTQLKEPQADRCFFRNPTPGLEVKRIWDARPLANDNVAVVTNAGLAFYSKAHHTWIKGPEHLMTTAGRLYLLPGYLVIEEITTTGANLTLAPLASIKIPTSCSQARVTMAAETIQIKSLAVHEELGRAAWLLEDGRIIQWQAGKQRELLAPIGEAPAQRDLRHIYKKTEKQLLFTTNTEVWQYDMANGSWSRYPLAFENDGIQPEHLNIGRQDDETRITARDSKGGLHMGYLDEAAKQLDMEQLYTRPNTLFRSEPKNILDVQGSSNTLWCFVFNDRIKYYDSQTRQWLGEQKYPEPAQQVTYAQGAGLDIISLNDGNQWLIAQDYRLTGSDAVLPHTFASYQPNRAETTAIDSTRHLWRLTADGSLSRSQTSQSHPYRSFTKQAGPAFEIDPDRVRQAIEWEGLLILDTAERLYVLDQETDESYRLPAALQDQVNLSQARAFEKELWLHNERGLYRMRRGPDRSLNGAFTANIRELIFDQAGTPWVRLAGQWHVWDGSAFVPPWLKDEPSAPAPTQLFVWEGGQVTGLDHKAVPYHWRAGFIAEEMPLDEAVVQNVQALFPDNRTGWWVITGSQLVHATRGYCRIDELGNQADCLKETERLTLPNRFQPIDWARAGVGADGILQIDRADGQTVSILPIDGNKHRMQRGRAANQETAQKDQWPQLQQHMRTLADGTQRYNPIEKILTTDAGTLIARRPSGERMLAARGDVHLQQAAALDVGWLSWDRATTDFKISTANGKQTMKASALIPAGQLIFDQLDDFLVEQQGLYAANPFGIWHFPGGRLRLDDPKISYNPKQIERPIIAEHGTFRTPQGRIDSAGRRVGDRPHRVSLQDVTFSESEQGLTGTIKVGKEQLDAFAEQGFSWDTNRQQLLYEENSLLLRSGTGFRPANQLGGFDYGPPESAAGRAYRGPDGKLYLEVETRWYRRDQGHWSQVKASPFRERDLFSGPTWTWRISRGALQVEEKGGKRAIVETAHGPAFAGDILEAAAFPEGQFALMTQAHFEIAADSGRYAKGQTRTYPHQPSERLTVFKQPGSGAQLYRQNQGKVSRWNATRETFVKQASNPYQERTLVASETLRITRKAETTHIQMKQQRLNGGTHWVDLELQDGKFPFDKVTAIGTEGDTLYVGTAVGLQVYKGGAQTKLQTHYDLRQNGQAAAVQRIGRQKKEPTTIIVQTQGQTLKAAHGQPLQKSQGEALLGERIRIDDPFWRWTQNSAGQVEGRYRSEANTESAKIAMTDGRLPHDRLRDIATWQGRAYSLWENGWLTQYATDKLDLAGPVINHNLAHLKPKQFLVVGQLGAPRHLTNGLYLEIENQRYLQRANQQWREERNPVALNDLREIRNNPPLYQRARLRLRQGVNLRFEQCTRKGIWRPLDWINGRVAIDQWSAMITVGEHIWAATPAGLVTYHERKDALVVEPDKLTIVRELTGQKLRLTDLMKHEGRVLARMNEDSSKVYEGQLKPTQDSGVFQAHKGRDPFAERDYITAEQSGYWRWQVEGRKRGRRGNLKATLGGETLQLVAGRFDFDTLNSLALYVEGQLDLATDQGGWYREARASHHVGDLRRVQQAEVNPLEIRGVSMGRDEKGAVLELQTETGSTICLSESSDPQEVQGFREYQGEDDLWRYSRSKAGLVIEALTEFGGQGRRSLTKGRFSDDRVLGFPIATGTGYLLPTFAGVLQINAEMRPAEIHTGPYPGLGEDGVPAVLIRREGTVLYAGQQAFYKLQGTRAKQVGMGLAAPDDYRLESLESLPHNGWMAYWQHGERRGFTRLRDQDMATYPPNRLYVDLSTLASYIEHKLSWGNPEPWMYLDILEREIRVQAKDRSNTARLELPQHFRLLKPLRKGTRLYLFGQRTLLEIKLNRLVEELFQEQKR